MTDKKKEEEEVRTFASVTGAEVKADEDRTTQAPTEERDSVRPTTSTVVSPTSAQGKTQAPISPTASKTISTALNTANVIQKGGAEGQAAANALRQNPLPDMESIQGKLQHYNPNLPPDHPTNIAAGGQGGKPSGPVPVGTPQAATTPQAAVAEPAAAPVESVRDPHDPGAWVNQPQLRHPDEGVWDASKPPSAGETTAAAGMIEAATPAPPPEAPPPEAPAEVDIEATLWDRAPEWLGVGKKPPTTIDGAAWDDLVPEKPNFERIVSAVLGTITGKPISLGKAEDAHETYDTSKPHPSGFESTRDQEWKTSSGESSFATDLDEQNMVFVNAEQARLNLITMFGGDLPTEHTNLRGETVSVNAGVRARAIERADEIMDAVAKRLLVTGIPDGFYGHFDTKKHKAGIWHPRRIIAPLRARERIHRKTRDNTGKSLYGMMSKMGSKEKWSHVGANWMQHPYYRDLHTSGEGDFVKGSPDTNSLPFIEGETYAPDLGTRFNSAGAHSDGSDFRTMYPMVFDREVGGESIRQVITDENAETLLVANWAEQKKVQLEAWVMRNQGLNSRPDLSKNESDRISADYAAIKNIQEQHELNPDAAGDAPYQYWREDYADYDEEGPKRQASKDWGKKNYEALVGTGGTAIAITRKALMTRNAETGEWKRNNVDAKQWLAAMENSNLPPAEKAAARAQVEEIMGLETIEETQEGTVKKKDSETSGKGAGSNLPQNIRDVVTANTGKAAKALEESQTEGQQGADAALSGITSPMSEPPPGGDVQGEATFLPEGDPVSREKIEIMSRGAEALNAGEEDEKGIRAVYADGSGREVVKKSDYRGEPAEEPGEATERDGATDKYEAPLGEKGEVVLNAEGEQVDISNPNVRGAVVNESERPKGYTEEKWNQLTARGKVAAIGRSILDDMGMGGAIIDINDSGTTQDEWAEYTGRMMGDKRIAALANANPTVKGSLGLVAAVAGGRTKKLSSPAEINRRAALSAKQYREAEKKAKAAEPTGKARTEWLQERMGWALEEMDPGTTDLEDFEKDPKAWMDKYIPDSKRTQAMVEEARDQAEVYKGQKKALARDIWIAETLGTAANALTNNSAAAYINGGVKDPEKFVAVGLREAQKRVEEDYDANAFRMSIYNMTGELLPEGMSQPAMEKLLPTLQQERRAKENNIKYGIALQQNGREYRAKELQSFFTNVRGVLKDEAAANGALAAADQLKKDYLLKVRAENRAERAQLFDQFTKADEAVRQSGLDKYKVQRDKVADAQWETIQGLNAFKILSDSDDARAALAGKALVANQGKPLPSETVTKLAGQKTLIGSLDVLSSMMELYPEETNTGPADDGLHNVMVTMGGGNVTYEQFRSYAMNVMNTYVFTMTGKQMSKVEVNRIKSVLPKPSQGVAVFKGMVQAFRAYAVRNLRNQVKYHTANGSAMKGIAGQMPIRVGFPRKYLEGKKKGLKIPGKYDYESMTVADVTKMIYHGAKDHHEVAKRFNALRFGADDGVSLWSPEPLSFAPGQDVSFGNARKEQTARQRATGVRLGPKGKVYGGGFSALRAEREAMGVDMKGLENIPGLSPETVQNLLIEGGDKAGGKFGSGSGRAIVERMIATAVEPGSPDAYTAGDKFEEDDYYVEPEE